MSSDNIKIVDVDVLEIRSIMDHIEKSLGKKVFNEYIHAVFMDLHAKLFEIKNELEFERRNEDRRRM